MISLSSTARRLPGAAPAPAPRRGLSARPGPGAPAPPRDGARPPRSRPARAKSEDDDDSDAPVVMGDWRAFRAGLVAEEVAPRPAPTPPRARPAPARPPPAAGPGLRPRPRTPAAPQKKGGRGLEEGAGSRKSDANLRVLRRQSEALADEEIWCHPTGAPELGGLLVARPNAHTLLEDSMVWQAVVFLLRHDGEGSIGVMLNRPTALLMAPPAAGGLPLNIDGFDDAARSRFAESRIYMGGPHAQQAIHALHPHGHLAGAEAVVPGIYAGGQAEGARQVADGRLRETDFRFFSGVFTWRPGQLEREIQLGGWYTAACSRNVVLKHCLRLPTPLWREVMELMGGEHGSTAQQVYGEM